MWTLEEKGEKPNINVSFNDAVPTKTHMALVKLVEQGNFRTFHNLVRIREFNCLFLVSGKVNFVISQNIDGLHLRSGLPRKHLAELHGNMFIEQCHQCQRYFIRVL